MFLLVQMENYALGAPTFKDVEAAEQNLQGTIHATPAQYSDIVSLSAKNEVFLKLENLQRTGSYKLRGAFHKFANLTRERSPNGIISPVTGNHAEGIAYAARFHGVSCTLVMPKSTPVAKIQAAEGHRAHVQLFGQTYSDAYQKAQELARMQHYTWLDPFDDPFMVAGQATIGLEILTQIPAASAVVVPMGGGALAGGIALALKSMNPKIKVYGVDAVNPAEFSRSQSPREPNLDGTVEKVRLEEMTPPKSSPMNLELVRRYVDDLVRVREEEIWQAMILLMEHHKLVSDQEGASALAAVIQGKIPTQTGDVAVLVSGGNVDMNLLPQILSQGLKGSHGIS